MNLANNQGHNENCAQEYVMNVTWGLLQPPQGQKRHEDLKLALLREGRGRRQDAIVVL
jgi:hypothetical protein